MSDLFQLVKQDKLGKQKQFWGHYQFLNDPVGGNLSNSALQKLQIAKLKVLEKENIKMENANKLLKLLDQVNADQIHEQIGEMSANQIYARIMALLNSGLISSELNPRARNLVRDEKGKFIGYKEGSNAETIKQESYAILEELSILLEMINYANAGQLTSNLAKALLGGGSVFGNEPDGRKFHSYSQYKADEAENLMVHAIQQNSSWKALQTGTFYNKGKQLLEDAFAFDEVGMKIEFDAGLGFSIKKDGKITQHLVKNLDEFFKLYENLTGNYQITLSDELYEKFQQLSILSAQSKSGVKLQHLLNTNSTSRNAISLNELGPTESLIGLYRLYSADWIDGTKDSETLTAMTNYCLSKGIALTNVMGNQIYFTRDGFVMASRWMELYNQMLKFNPSISKISNNLLDKQNPYAFSAVDK